MQLYDKNCTFLDAFENHTFQNHNLAQNHSKKNNPRSQNIVNKLRISNFKESIVIA